jgi:hypothetical protein
MTTSTQLRYPVRSLEENGDNLPTITFKSYTLSVEGEGTVENLNSKSVVLNLPKAYLISDSFNYEEFSLNNLQSLFMEQFNEDSSSVLSGLEFLGTGAVQLASNLGGDTIRGLINRRRGQVFNPKQFTLFKSPSLRQFGFSFKFLPENPKEVEIVTQILLYFRKNSYPGISEGGIGFTVPSFFKILINSAPDIIKVPSCVCTSISTNYNQTSPSYFKNPNPTSGNSFFPSEIELTLGFQEFKVITRENIEGNSL